MWNRSVALEKANDVYRNRRTRKRLRWFKKNWKELTAIMTVVGMVSILIGYIVVLIAQVF